MFRIIYYFAFFIIVALLILDRDLNFFSTKLRIAEIMIGGIVYDLVAHKKNKYYQLFSNLAYFFASTSIFIIFMILIAAADASTTTCILIEAADALTTACNVGNLVDFGKRRQLSVEFLKSGA